MQNAGGEVVDRNGFPIKNFGHRGVFVAATDPQRRDQILEIVNTI